MGFWLDPFVDYMLCFLKIIAIQYLVEGIEGLKIAKSPIVVVSTNAVVASSMDIDGSHIGGTTEQVLSHLQG